MRNFVIAPMRDERMQRALQSHQHPGRTAGNLRHQVRAIRVVFAHALEHVAEAVGIVVDLRHRKRDRQASLGREFDHPLHRCVGADHVRRHLEHAVPDVAHRAADSQQLSLAGESSRHQILVLGAMEHRARGGESQRAGLERIAHEGRHLRDVVGGRFLVARPALAHHVGAQRAVRHLRADVEHARHLLDRVHVFGKRFPAPLDSFGERAAWNVLDPFHQADQKLLLPRLHRRKADPAVAHHDCRNAVPARRAEVRIPRDLAVVVRMDVDPSRRHHEARRIDFAPRRARFRADACDHSVVDRDVAVERRRSAAIDNFAVSNYQIMHGFVLPSEESRIPVRSRKRKLKRSFNDRSLPLHIRSARTYDSNPRWN